MLVGSSHQIPLNHPDWFNTPDQILKEHNLFSGTVADLIHPNKKTWNWNILRRLYDHNTCEEINKIPIAKTEGNLDKLIWKYSALGEYNVAKAYSLIQQIQNTPTRIAHIIEEVLKST